MKVALELQPCCGNRSGIGMYTYELAKRLRSENGLEFAGNVFNFLGRNDNAAALSGIEMPVRVQKSIPYGVYRRIWHTVPFSYNMLFPAADLNVFFNFIVPPRVKGKVITVIYDMTYLRFPETMNESNLRRIQSDIGYQSELQLGQLEGIHISFSVNCPPDNAGNQLYIDLYNYEAGYDFAEQEHQVTLQEGQQQISFDLSPGEQAPDSCFLRFFTNGLADYALEQLQVYPVIACPKVTTAMMGAVGITLLLLASTVIYVWYQERKSNHEKGSF